MQTITPIHNGAILSHIAHYNRRLEEFGEIGLKKYIKRQEARYREIMTELEAAFREGRISVNSIMSDRTSLHYSGLIRDLIAVVSELLILNNPRNIFDIKKVMQNELAKIVSRISEIEPEQSEENQEEANDNE